MKKTILWILLTASAGIQAPSFADSTGTEFVEQTIPEQYIALDIDDEDEDVTPQGTPVAPETNTAQKARNREFWKNLILASTAVIVAVVSILIVSNNNGKKK